MHIREKLSEFISFVLSDKRSENDLSLLIRKLDELPILVDSIPYEFDENDYPSAPHSEHREIRSRVESKFPELGVYHSASYDEDLNSNETVVVGDAVDDITDIVGDLIEIEWYFENTSDADALWHLETSYRSHWGNHLREVQLYLYRQHY